MNIERKSFSVIFVLIIINSYGSGLESNKQRYNPNTDFLLHEAGQVNIQLPISATNNREASNKRDYVSQFPPLNSPKDPSPVISPTSTSTTAKVTNNIQTPSGKRDYVAPQTPSTKPTFKTTLQTTPQTLSQTNAPSSGRRDYVNPNFPPLRPTQGNTSGNVKGLINFYENKDNSNNRPQAPSYSSILQGQSGKIGTNGPVSKPSSISNSATSTTTQGRVQSVNGGKSPQSTSNTILPSSIVNTNQGNSGGVTDIELQTISEELLRKDANNAAKYVTINYQGKTTGSSIADNAPLPLLNISNEVWNIPTVQKFLPLLDNYERDTLVNEYITPQERNEENAFLDTIMSTAVIRHLITFLRDKGYLTADPRDQRDYLKQIWFGMYSRGKGKISSSGFEHVFVSELKNGEVIGLHNWLYFGTEESSNRLNYLGYIRYLTLSNKGAVIKLHFTQQGVNKPVDTIFIGTSPELELALYTLCFATRVDNDCKLKLDGKDVDIVTYNYRYRSKNYIGSAYPQI